MNMRLQIIESMPEYLDDLEKYWDIVLKTDTQDKFVELVLRLLDDVQPNDWYKIVKILQADIDRTHKDVRI